MAKEESVNEELKKKEPAKEAADEKPKQQWKQVLATLGRGVATFLIALKVIIISFLKAITLNFFQNVKAGWGEVSGKPAEKPKQESKKKK